MESIDRNTLFFNNIKLVPFCYGKYYNDQKHLREDFIQAGYLGLWNACLEFDPTKGKFSTFAIRCIRRQMSILLHDEKKHRFECGYDVIQDNGSITNVLDTEDNGEYALEISEIETANIINGLKHKDIYSEYLNGIDAKDIARKHNLQRTNVNTRVHRCKKKIRELYGERKNSL